MAAFGHHQVLGLSPPTTLSRPDTGNIPICIERRARARPTKAFLLDLPLDCRTGRRLQPRRARARQRALAARVGADRRPEEREAPTAVRPTPAKATLHNACFVNP